MILGHNINEKRCNLIINNNELQIKTVLYVKSKHYTRAKLYDEPKCNYKESFNKNTTIKSVNFI